MHVFYRQYFADGSFVRKAFTGTITDSMGRKRQYINGVPVEGHHDEQGQNKPHADQAEQAENHDIASLTPDQKRRLEGKIQEKLNAKEQTAGYIPDFDFTKLDAASKSELKSIEGTALQSNKNEPVIVIKNSDGTYKLLDGFGRISGLRNAGKTTAHAIVIKQEDLPEGWKSIADDNDTIAEIHYKYKPDSHLAKPGGSESSGIFYNTFDDAIEHGEYDPIYPFMVDRDGWVKERMANDGYTKEEAEKEHQEDVEDTLKSNPRLVHRFVKQQYK